MPDSIMFEQEDELDTAGAQKKLADAKLVGQHAKLGPIYMVRDKLGVKTYYVIMPDGTKVYTPYGSRVIGTNPDGTVVRKKFTVEDRPDYNDVLEAREIGVGLEGLGKIRAAQLKVGNPLEKTATSEFVTQPIVSEPVTLEQADGDKINPAYHPNITSVGEADKSNTAPKVTKK